MHGLRLQTEMAHDGNAHVNQPLHDVGDRSAAFQLHGGGATFLQQPAGVADGFPDADLEREKRHVGDDEGALGAAGDGSRVVHHGVQGHRKRASRGRG